MGFTSPNEIEDNKTHQLLDAPTAPWAAPRPQLGADRNYEQGDDDKRTQTTTDAKKREKETPGNQTKIASGLETTAKIDVNVLREGPDSEASA